MRSYGQSMLTWGHLSFCVYLRLSKLFFSPTLAKYLASWCYEIRNWFQLPWCLCISTLWEKKVVWLLDLNIAFNTFDFHPTANDFWVEFRSCHQKTRAEFQNYPKIIRARIHGIRARIRGIRARIGEEWFFGSLDLDLRCVWWTLIGKCFGCFGDKVLTGNLFSKSF